MTYVIKDTGALTSTMFPPGMPQHICQLWLKEFFKSVTALRLFQDYCKILFDAVPGHFIDFFKTTLK